MATVTEAALRWHSAGVSTIPIVQGGSKRPLVRWSEYQTRIPSLGEVDRWFGNGMEYGLAVICGAISGGLEMVELESEANTGETLLRLDQAMAAAGIEDLWVDLTAGEDAYMEVSPSGGMHVLFRIADAPVPGNTKIAWRAATEAELAVNPDEKWKVLAETRGEGGYVIVAPTTGLCHPTGQPWTLAVGEYGSVPTITKEQRDALLAVIRETLDESPQTPAPLPHVTPTSPGPLATRSGAGLSPGDDFEATTDWAEILEPHGWTLESRRGPERYWTRPGKERRDGASATTGRAGDRDRLYVFSTSTEFRTETPYTKFGAHALLNFGGDHSAAARDLVRQGYGSRGDADPFMSGHAVVDAEMVDPATTDVAVVESSTIPRSVRGTYTLDDIGNARRFAEHAKGRYHWVTEAKAYYAWTGRVWAPDDTGALHRDWRSLTDQMSAYASATDDEALGKWVRASRTEAREGAATRMMRQELGVSRSAADFDQAGTDWLNVGNGILNVRTGQLVPHHPGAMMTRMVEAEYHPEAQAPLFDKFIETMLPDPQLRAYVQRCVGYTLYGQPTERALFMAYGPKSTGKSTFMEVIGDVLGTYAGTAAPGTFKQSHNDKGPSADLHSLRGKRFVATSESSDSARFDEDLIKRVTGNDKITSRALYQAHETWKPECSIWLATNFPPRFNSDDDAIWDRAKLIPFLTEVAPADRIPGLAMVISHTEASGVLNWVLAGLRDYLAHGLGEPTTVTEAAVAHRDSTDQVMVFLDQRVQDGALVLDQTSAIPTRHLFSMYQAWARDEGTGQRPLDQRRFLDRLRSSHRPIQVTGSMVRGLRQVVGHGVLGSMPPPPTLYQD